VYGEQALAEYLRCFRDPAAIHASCEDYRAGASVDYALDEADLGKRKIACPTLVLSGRFISRLDPLAVWRRWADDVTVQDLPCGHFIPEEAPGEALAALRPFLAG
jgi:haloacetate dehalogenase